MTSNLGLRELTQQAKLGFTAEADDKRQEDWQNEWQQTKEQLLAEVKKFFRPEFLNRLDGVIVFNPLSESALAQIVKLQIKELNARFSAQKLALQIKLARGAAEAIARATFSPQEGARGIRRYLTDKVEDPLTQKLLTAKLKTPLEVTLSVKKNGEIKLS